LPQSIENALLHASQSHYQFHQKSEVSKKLIALTGHGYDAQSPEVPSQAEATFGRLGS
jgi:hypothetical protein